MNKRDKNIAYLQQEYSILADRLDKFSKTADLNIEKCTGDNAIITLGNCRCFVHSVYNVKHEMHDMFSGINPDIEHIVIFGLGMGHAIKYAKDHCTSLKRISVIEPYMEWFEFTLEHVDWSDILSDNACNIVLYIGHTAEVTVWNFISDVTYDDKEFALVHHVSSRTFAEEYYKRFTEFIVDQVRATILNLRTHRYIALPKIWNALCNFTEPAYRLESFAEFFKGRDAIIVSAGPSLKKNMHLLPELYNKAIIIAVGSAIRILDHAGIKPHFRLAVDPWPGEKKDIFDVLKDKSIPLLYINAVHHKILPEYQGPLIRVLSVDDHLGKYLYKNNEMDTMPIFTGPSVANIALGILCRLAVNSVTFIGQDMCQYGRQIHADIPVDSYHANDADIVTTKDIYGQEVTSPRPYYVIKQCMEEMLQILGADICFYNATEGGLGINGVPNVTLQEMILRHEKIMPLGDIIQELIEKEERLTFKEDLVQIKADVKQLQRLNKKKDKELKLFEDMDLLQMQARKHQIIDRLKKVQNFEKQMQKYEIYKEVIERNLETLLVMAHTVWGRNLNSDNEQERLYAAGQVYMRVTNELETYLNCMKQVLDTACE